MMAVFFLGLLAVASSLFPCYASAASDDTPSPSFVIAGYLPDYRTYININATAPLLTDLMLFSLTPETILEYDESKKASGSAGGCCLSSEHYDKFRQARSYKNHLLQQAEASNKQQLRLLLTVGGGGRSNGFNRVVMGDIDLQRKFAKNLVQVCHDEKLDGIDLDFEGIASKSEWIAYLKLIHKVSTYLHKHDLLLTVAVHPGQTVPANVCQSLDRLHVMTYDMIGSSSPGAGNGSDEERRPKHHASLYSVHDAIAKFIQGGCEPSKIIMGIPAYGRHEHNPGQVKTYSEIYDELAKSKNNDMKQIKEAIVSMNAWEGYQFDSPQDIRAKVHYATQSGLGGVFLWELGQDKQIPRLRDGGILLDMAQYSAKFYTDKSSDRGPEEGKSEL